jgi:allantoicase
MLTLGESARKRWETQQTAGLQIAAAGIVQKVIVDLLHVRTVFCACASVHRFISLEPCGPAQGSE